MSPTITVGSFIRRVRFTFLFMCSKSSTWTTDVQNILETPEPRPKQKHRRPEPRLHRIPPLVFFTRICFGTKRLFWTFLDSTKGSPSFVSIFCNIMDVEKSQRHCDTVRKSHFKKFFGNFLKPLKGPSLFFFKFCSQLEIRKAQGVPPFTILSLRYIADFGRSRLLFDISRVPHIMNLNQWTPPPPQRCMCLAATTG